MKRFSKVTLLALGFVILAVSLASVTSNPVDANGAAPVNIARVTVPSVPVSGNVNVANTPGVSVTNTPTVSLAAGSSVNVTNPLDAQSNPTPLATLDASQRYEDQCNIPKFAGANFGNCNFQAVPAGKRLVIQEVDVAIQVDTGLKPTNIEVFTNGSTAHQFTGTFMGTATLTGLFFPAPGNTPVCGQKPDAQLPSAFE